MILGIGPDSAIVSLGQTNIADMGGPGEQGRKETDKTR